METEVTSQIHQFFKKDYLLYGDMKILHNFWKVSQSIVDEEDEESRVDREFTELSEQR